MAKRKVFIQNREFIPEVAEILGMNIIDLEWEFGKADILGVVCVFDAEIGPEQAKEIDRRALERRGKAPKRAET